MVSGKERVAVFPLDEAELSKVTTQAWAKISFPGNIKNKAKAAILENRERFLVVNLLSIKDLRVSKAISW
jgi:hypothetical protein